MKLLSRENYAQWVSESSIREDSFSLSFIGFIDNAFGLI